MTTLVKNSTKRQIVMTCALPYANGPIHLGHMIEHIEADIYARFQKMRGHECIFICADDTHGTPIMIKAREQGITPEQLIARSFDDHCKDFSDFNIQFDHYGSTNSDENRQLCELFYERMSAGQHVHKKPIEQLYCEHDKMFLPDRFVKGTCPKCKTTDQYGDSCDSCGATYSPQDLIGPGCSLCGTPPVKKSSDHIFFKLNSFKEYLKEWLPQHTSSEISKKMMEWFNEDLRDWDISRDEPYFGFAIPGEKGKYFYVWVDAPMGYVSSLDQWAKKNNRQLSEFWSADSKTEIYHFIGKDIVYFHTLFWPALLKSAGFKSPTGINVHGHVMVNGEKMSKSKGTFIAARVYLNHLDPQFLRYYYATKINGSIDDMDLNFDDFTSRVNSDLVGKIVNLASRGAQMLSKKMDSTMSTPDEAGLKVLSQIDHHAEQIAKYYDVRDFAKATTLIRECAEITNKYFDEKAPWKTLETDPAGTKQVLTTTLNAFRKIAIFLQPVLPAMAQQVATLLGERSYVWNDHTAMLTNHKVNDYVHLAQRVDPEKIKSMIEEQKQIYAAVEKPKKPATAATSVKGAKAETAAPTEIEFEDFAKIDLRIAQIIEAEEIKEADKLLRLKVELESGNTKQIIAGIKSAYSAEKLLGRKVLICANLKPRKMKFGISEGMVLAAGDGGTDLFVLSADEGAKAGSKVK
ncbi:methionine--tRNA ligase [Pseudobdellovibrio exovorus]|uniref:Methionine--tRNA ligase n=1 Tax=Pseudobdellovibrio exovorus JSS TaxID=1184267 RepID=M4VB14_9BACT|nr:methionine--tRNA ligase [Pseudobdellovibrio exovorus]AGH95665.1 methionyl-tRNA synthetase [Pseudobdellovibrio exovorus JSS]